MPGPAANSILAMLDVSAVTLDSPAATPYRALFSDPVILIENTACGVEFWEETDYDAAGDGTNQVLRCTLADVTGDGIVDRIDHGVAYIGLGTAFSSIEIPMPTDFAGQHFSKTVPLPDAASALRYQQNVLRTATGRYHEMTNSCLTHCGDVLRAGGVEGVPKTTLEIFRWLRKL